MFDLFDSSISLNKKIHNLILDFEGETRDFEYFTINNIPFDEPVLTDIELNDYFSENEKDFRIKYFSQFSIVVLYLKFLSIDR